MMSLLWLRLSDTAALDHEMGRAKSGRGTSYIDLTVKVGSEIGKGKPFFELIIKSRGVFGHTHTYYVCTHTHATHTTHTNLLVTCRFARPNQPLLLRVPVSFTYKETWRGRHPPCCISHTLSVHLLLLTLPLLRKILLIVVSRSCVAWPHSLRRSSLRLPRHFLCLVFDRRPFLFIRR